MFFLRSLFLRILETRPGWVLARWAGIGLGLLVLTVGGFYFFRPAACDVVYSSRWVIVPASQGRTAAYCTLEIGNAGENAQEDVKIHFLKSALDHAILRPLAKDGGVVERPISIRTSGLRATLALGRLEPGALVTVNLILNYTAFETPPAWEVAFRGIEPARGKARIGDPGAAAGRGSLRRKH